jgi:two-component system KDP operon response regulator KdpE
MHLLMSLGLEVRALEAIFRFVILAVSGSEVREPSISGQIAEATSAPISINEAAALIAAAVGYIGLKSASDTGGLSVGAIKLDPLRRAVTKHDQSVPLTPKEFDLLHYLMSRAGAPVRATELLRKIRGVECSQNSEYLRTYVCQLRKKLEDTPTAPQYLLTEPRFGYLFVGPDADQLTTMTSIEGTWPSQTHRLPP